MVPNGCGAIHGLAFHLLDGGLLQGRVVKVPAEGCGQDGQQAEDDQDGAYFHGAGAPGLSLPQKVNAVLFRRGEGAFPRLHFIL